MPFYFERNRGIAELGLTLQPFGRSNVAETMTDEPIALYRGGFEAAAAEAVKAHFVRTRGDRRWDLTAIRSPAGGFASSPATRPRVTASFGTLEVERASPAPLLVRPATSWRATAPR